MNVGGPAIQVTTLMNSLADKDVTQLLLTGECEDGEVDYLELNGIDLERRVSRNLGRRINPMSDVKAFFEIRETIKTFKPNIVHTHTFKAGLLGRLAALSLTSRPLLVHTFHGHLLEGYFKGYKLFVLKVIERHLSSRTDFLVSVGEKVMQDLLEQRIGSRERFVVIPPGFSLQPIENSDVLSKTTRHSGITCAWVGRIVDIKAPSRILEIARVVKENKLNIRFLVAGDGPLRFEIQAQSEKESLPIEFLGWTKDVASLLSQVDLLLLTSLSEGTPISIIEAQRLGKPVVATDVGSVREVICDGESGYARHYDPDCFAKLIESFLSETGKLAQFSEAAIRFSTEKFAPERLAKDYLNVYRSLLN